ncbi:MAG TPA: beta-ketoacyl-[acyl-carrier-protein] synthase family protein [Solirubrobacterales bacterium]|jgi:3-oxoacyl-[acyl-carrier-protein] synthase II|nr:beta-ketoacyl-[acyl-carrier-protein] synthase family protein [Solirubrobacterales bacterium]
MPDVVVTGLGAVSPAGFGAQTLYDRACAGEAMPPGDVAAGPDPSEKLSVKEARRLDRFSRFALIAALEAVEDAGLDFDQIDLDRAGVVAGTGIGGIETIDTGLDIMREKGERMVPATAVPMLMPNAATSAISMKFGLRGPGHCVSSACATGNHALGEAKRMIERGEADIVLAGSAEAANRPLAMAAFRAMGAMSSKGLSCPFDARRDGFVMGEGAGIVVLEAAEHAAARGVEVYGKIAGYATTHDAYHLVQPDPSGRGAIRAMQMALDDAGLSTVDYINAHGTSTPFNDLAETTAIKQVFSSPPPISSTKSVVGHLLGGAGAVEAVASLLSIKHDKAHPTVNLEQPDPECDLDYIPEGAREFKIDSVLSNSFGFGGHNACLIFTAA